MISQPPDMKIEGKKKSFRTINNKALFSLTPTRLLTTDANYEQQTEITAIVRQVNYA